MTRILEELHREVKHAPLVVLEDLMRELRWCPRMLSAGAVDPLAQVRVPKNPHLLLPETIEVQLRWHRKVGHGEFMRCGANMPPFTDVECALLSRASLKERMEAWFSEVLKRI